VTFFNSPMNAPLMAGSGPRSGWCRERAAAAGPSREPAARTSARRCGCPNPRERALVELRQRQRRHRCGSLRRLHDQREDDEHPLHVPEFRFGVRFAIATCNPAQSRANTEDTKDIKKRGVSASDQAGGISMTPGGVRFLKISAPSRPPSVENTLPTNSHKIRPTMALRMM